MSDPRVVLIVLMLEHAAWADPLIAHALSAPSAPAAAIREFAHVAGASEVWLSRIEGRKSTTAVWPELSVAEAKALLARTAAAYSARCGTLTDALLDAPVTYTNSAGRSFSTPLADILTHVALHAQYHRGKVNLLLREAGLDPAPTDFISFARGVAAAVTPVAR